MGVPLELPSFILSPGLVQINNDRVYIGAVDGTVMEVVTMNHELNIGTINGLTVDDILDKMVERKIGIAHPEAIFQCIPTVGRHIRIGDHIYTIAHVITETVYITLSYWEEDCQFKSNGSSVTYSGSDLKDKCILWYETEVPASLKSSDVFIPSNIDGVVAECFIPDEGHVNPSQSTCWDFFKTGNNRQFFDKNRTAAHKWWTSTKSSSTRVRIVETNAEISYTEITASCGFRPSLAIYRSAFLNL